MEMRERWLSEEDRSFYRREGYIVLRGVYDPGEMEAVKQEFSRLWLDMLVSGKIRQDPELPMESLFPTMHEVNRHSEVIRNFMLNPIQFAIAEEILQEEAMIVGTTCFFKAPCTKSLPLHQDNIDNGCLPAKNCAIWTSLDDSDRSNGSLVIIPGTHKFGLLSVNAPADDTYGLLSVRVPEPGESARLLPEYEIVHIETSAGDVVIFDGHTVHGSTSNVTRDRFRRSFATHFTARSVEKVYANFQHLIDKDGQIVQKPVNKTHGRVRRHLLPEWKMAEGEKIY